MTVCGRRFGKLLSFCFFLCLFSSLCYCEEGVYLTQEEFNQIQQALALSETELNLSQTELKQVKSWLTEAQTGLTAVSSIPKTLLEQFNEREISWIKQSNEQQKTINRQNLIIKFGAIGIGILGGVTLIRGL